MTQVIMNSLTSVVLVSMFVCVDLTHRKLCDVRVWYLNIIIDDVFNVDLNKEQLQLKQSIEALVLNSADIPDQRLTDCHILYMYNDMLREVFNYNPSGSGMALNEINKEVEKEESKKEPEKEESKKEPEESKKEPGEVGDPANKNVQANAAHEDNTSKDTVNKRVQANAENVKTSEDGSNENAQGNAEKESKDHHDDTEPQSDKTPGENKISENKYDASTEDTESKNGNLSDSMNDTEKKSDDKKDETEARSQADKIPRKNDRTDKSETKSNENSDKKLAATEDKSESDGSQDNNDNNKDNFRNANSESLDTNDDASDSPHKDHSDDDEDESDETDIDETDLPEEEFDEEDSMETEPVLNRYSENGQSEYNTDEDTYITKSIPFGICWSFGCLRSDIFDAFGLDDIEMKESTDVDTKEENVEKEIKESTDADTKEENVVTVNKPQNEVKVSENKSSVGAMKVSHCEIGQYCNKKCYYMLSMNYCRLGYVVNLTCNINDEQATNDVYDNNEKQKTTKDFEGALKNEHDMKNIDDKNGLKSETGDMDKASEKQESDKESELEMKDINTEEKRDEDIKIMDDKSSKILDTLDEMLKSIDRQEKKDADETNDQSKCSKPTLTNTREEFEKIINSKTSQYESKIQTLELMIMKLENHLLTESLNKQNHSTTITRLENLILKLENDLLKMNKNYQHLQEETDNINKRQNKYLELEHVNENKQMQLPDHSSKNSELISQQQIKISELSDVLRNQSEMIKKMKDRYETLEEQNRMLHQMVMNQTIFMTSIIQTVQELTDQNSKSKKEIDELKSKMSSDRDSKYQDEKIDLSSIEANIIDKLDSMLFNLDIKQEDVEEPETGANEDDADINYKKYISEKPRDDIIRNWCPKQKQCPLSAYRGIIRSTCVPFKNLIWSPCTGFCENTDAKLEKQPIQVQDNESQKKNEQEIPAKLEEKQEGKETLEKDTKEKDITLISASESATNDEKEIYNMILGYDKDGKPVFKPKENQDLLTKLSDDNKDNNNQITLTDSKDHVSEENKEQAEKNKNQEDSNQPSSTEEQDNKKPITENDEEGENDSSIKIPEEKDEIPESKEKNLKEKEKEENKQNTGEKHTSSDHPENQQPESQNGATIEEVKESKNNKDDGKKIDMPLKAESDSKSSDSQVPENKVEMNKNESDASKVPETKSEITKESSDSKDAVQDDKDQTSKLATSKAEQSPKEKLDKESSNTNKDKTKVDESVKTNLAPSADKQKKESQDKQNAPLQRKEPINLVNARQKDPKDCYDYYIRGNKRDGLFKVKPVGSNKMIEVFCDMKKGGWTVIQRRQDGSLNFFQEWKDYKNGFGGLYGEHWLGNDNIHLLTNQDYYTLRVDLMDWEKNKKHALYSYFLVENEEEGYRLHIDGYTGDAGDGLTKHNVQKFSTKDVDNDKVVKEFGGSCAIRFTGAGWYYRCYASNLNGKYYRGGTIPEKKFDGVTWKPWTGPNYSLKKVEMKIRPLSAEKKT